jgi:hypothetical protein
VRTFFKLAFFFLLPALAALTAGGLWLYDLMPGSQHWFGIRHRFLPHLCFYSDAFSYAPGDSLRLYASAGSRCRAVASLRPLSGPDTAALFRSEVTLSFQPLPDSASQRGCGWQQSLAWRIPDEAPPGWYLAELRTPRRAWRQSIFIRPAAQAQRKVALILSTLTWNAYNPWGGQSLYTRNRAHRVSFLRPQPLADPWISNSLENRQLYYQAANKDLYLARLLDSAGIAFDVYGEEDLQLRPGLLGGYKALLFSTHSEYWTPEMLAHLNRCLEGGSSALVLAGNVCAWVTQYDSARREISVYKENRNLWEEADSAGLRPWGTEYDYLAFHTYAPYRVLSDSAWVFEGTGLKQGDLFGLRSDTYDYTFMYGSPWEALRGLLNRGRMGAASGLEIDKTYAHTPANWITLASGINPPVEGTGQVYPDLGLQWDQLGGADMGYYVHPGGGMVFHASSMSFTGAIPHDPAIRRIILNAVWKAGALTPPASARSPQ